MKFQRKASPNDQPPVPSERSALLDELWKLYQSRPSPEWVADTISRAGILRNFPAAEIALATVAGARRKTIIPQDFDAVSVASMRKAAAYLFPEAPFPADATPRTLGKWIAEAGWSIRRLPHQTFLLGRMNRQARKEAGLDLRRGQYNRRFRLLVRAEAKVDALALAKLGVMAKRGLADRVTRPMFDRDLLTAAYLTYISARLSRRSLFTPGRQDRAFDVAAKAMFRALVSSQSTCWLAAALVDPSPEVLCRLSDRERVGMLAAAEDLMRAIAPHLAQQARRLPVDRVEMIVHQGIDSSRWNALAGAWNRARAAWLGLVHELGADEMLDGHLPGKVMRLMAEDIAKWRKSLGKGPDPEARVWAELPAPWGVVQGRTWCNRAMVEEVCRRHGVDPYHTGWIVRPQRRVAVSFKPKPDTLHGIIVPPGSAIAAYLKAAGAFSGKPSGQPHPGLDIVGDLVRSDHIDIVSRDSGE